MANELSQQPNIDPEVETLESQESLLPSTIENQVMTEQAVDNQQIAQSNFDRKKEEMSVHTAQQSSVPTDTEVLDALEMEENQKIEEQNQIEQQKIQQQQQIENQLSQRQADLERAASKGITLPRNEQLDSLIEQRQNISEQSSEEEQLVDNAANAIVAQKVQDAVNPTDEEIQLQAAPIRNERAKMQAEQVAQNDELQKLQEQQREALNKVQQAQADISKIDPNNYWNSKSTGSKIIAAISMALGAVGAGLMGSSNVPALDVIQKQIDQDIDAQKTNNEVKLQRQMNAAKVVQMQLDQMQAKTNNDLQKQKLEQLKQGMLQKEQEHKLKLQEFYQNQQAKQGVNSGQLRSTAGLSKDDRDRAVRLSDGSIQLADNKDAATDVRKFVNETKPGLKALTRLERMIGDPNFSRLSLEDRAQANTERRTLVGALRLSLVGPGALTEKEMQLIQDTIGSPTKFLFSNVEKRKLEVLKKSLNSRIQDRYQSAGIQPPKSKRDKLIEHNMNKTKKSRSAIEKSINKLIQAGKLSQEFSE